MYFFLLTLLISENVANGLILNDVIQTAIEEFNIQDPTLIFNKTPKIREIVDLVKKLSKNTQWNGFRPRRDDAHESFIIFTNLIDFDWKFKSKAPNLIVTRIEKESDLSEFNVALDEEVYFLDSQKYDMYESYGINYGEKHVTRKLGNFSKNLQNGKINFIPIDGQTKNLIDRRRDFKGIQLKGKN